MTGLEKPLNLITVADELGRVKAYYECAFLAVADACDELSDVNAIQSVMAGARRRLNKVIDSLTDELARQRRLEEQAQTKAVPAKVRQ